MKKIFFSLLPIFLLTSFFSGLAFAEQRAFQSQQQDFFHEKIYVNSDCIAFDQGKIYILFNNQLLSVTSIHSDSFGIYFYDTEYCMERMYWECINGHTNPRSAYPTCLFCEKGPKR